MNPNSTKTFSWRTAILISMGVGLLAAGLSVFFQSRGLTVEAFAARLQTPTATAAPLGVGASYDQPRRPARLVIPAIGVDAKVQSVGLSWRGDGAMGIPTNFTDVGWYKEGPVPGAPGSAVIDGHMDGKDVKEAVFYDLGKLQPGDLVQVVDEGGKTLQFKVVGSKIYEYNAPTTEIFSGDTSNARLNLITCTGSWLKAEQNYEKRIVVFTERI